MNLVERILFTLVKLLPADINPLLSPQSRVLLFNLWHTTSLERRIRSLEPSFWVAVDLGGILVRQRQGVQRVIDTGCVEVSRLTAWRVERLLLRGGERRVRPSCVRLRLFWLQRPLCITIKVTILESY